MFDFAFSELLVVAVIALVVLGPERLPQVARQAGRWISRLRRYVDDVKTDLNREIDLAELRRMQSEVRNAASDFRSSVDSALSDTRSSLRSIESSLDVRGAASGAASGDPAAGLPPPASDAQPSFESASYGADTRATDWDAVYAVRRSRNRIRDRRIEVEQKRGARRPRRTLHR